jgi:hypothetical protein
VKLRYSGPISVFPAHPSSSHAEVVESEETLAKPVLAS